MSVGYIYIYIYKTSIVVESKVIKFLDEANI